MRPRCKARRPRIPGVFEGGATPQRGMQRRPNAEGFLNRTTRRVIRTLAISLLVQAAITHPGFAQTEDLEPRIIGTRGTTLLGVSGSFGRFFSTEDLYAGHY